MKATLLLPHELGRSVFSPPRKGVYNECFLSHSYYLQPRLLAWNENVSQQIIVPRNNLFLSSLQNQRDGHALPLQKMVTRLIFLPPPICSWISSLFFPSLVIFHLSNSQFCGSGQEVFRWVLFPSPHWLLRRNSQLPSWLVIYFSGSEDYSGSE